MAISRIKYGGVRGKALNYSEFLCDGIEDLENLPTNTKKTDDFPTCAIGSRAFIGDNTYMLFPSEGWKPTKLVVCDCGCIHGVGSDSESKEENTTDEPTTEDTTAEDLEAALDTIADIIDGSITSITDEKVTGEILGVFKGNTNITSISFANATSVDDNAFDGCTSLESVSLPLVTEIGASAFAGCTSIVSLSLPSATTIGENALQGCTALTDLYLPGAEASYTNAPFGLTTGDGAPTIHYEYDFTEDEGKSNTETPPEQQGNG